MSTFTHLCLRKSVLRSEPGAAQRFTTNLGVDRQRLWQREPNEKQVGSAEGQGEQSRRLVEDTFCHSGADGKVGSQQRPHGEAQREGDADHGLERIDCCFYKVGRWNLRNNFTFRDVSSSFESRRLPFLGSVLSGTAGLPRWQCRGSRCPCRFRQWLETKGTCWSSGKPPRRHKRTSALAGNKQSPY